jgi:hypothetical protein
LKLKRTQLRKRQKTKTGEKEVTQVLKLVHPSVKESFPSSLTVIDLSQTQIRIFRNKLHNDVTIEPLPTTASFITA